MDLVGGIPKIEKGSAASPVDVVGPAAVPVKMKEADSP